MSEPLARLAPIPPPDRIISLDVLRGFAILGILVMNVQSFSMIQAAYINPTAYGDLTGINKWVWILSHVFTDQKFMTLFSILFGAGIILLINKAEKSGKSAASLHYRRTFWLFVIGMIHAYLFWYGDILVTYSLCAVIVFWFHKLSPGKLLGIGIAVISVASILYFLFGLSMSFWPPEAYQETLASWKPGSEMVAAKLSAYRGSWIDQMAQRVPSSIQFQTFLFLIWNSWRAGGLMLVGMALFKWGVLSARRSNEFYRNISAIGFAAGLPVVIWGIVRNFSAGWSMDFSMFFGWQFNYWGSLFVATGYIGLVILICKSQRVEKVKLLLAGVGKTALSNYLLQTLICTTIFYGHGFGLFGKIERSGQILIVLGVWVFQIAVTSIWMRNFRFGPAEWLWRSLTYLKLQPMKAQRS